MPAKERNAYKKSLKLHIASVQKAGKILSVPAEQLACHDDSKWGHDEFQHYARQAHGDKGDPIGYARAWLHHQNSNPHHWEYWILRSDGVGPRYGHHCAPANNGAVDGCLEMPEQYVREMVADWMGASFAYTGSWNIGDWLTANLDRMKIHPATLNNIIVILGDSLGYHVSWDAQTNLHSVFLNEEADAS